MIVLSAVYLQFAFAVDYEALKAANRCMLLSPWFPLQHQVSLRPDEYFNNLPLTCLSSPLSLSLSPQWTCVYEFQEGAPTRPLVSPRCSLRLTHYIEEANVGRGYIKELCFSPDGRLICSPYGYGVRLLAFDESCGELADCLPVQTSCLREIRSIYSHSDVVLTTKFSPTHCQLASGCLSGRVALYQPKF